MSDDVNVSFGASIEGLVAGLKGVRSEIEDQLAPINEMREALSGIGEVLAGTFAIEKIVDFTKEMAELGEQVGRTAEMLGLTTQAVTELQFASTVTGGSADQMSTMMERLSRTMATAASGGLAQQAAFREAGVAYEDANGKLRPLSDMLGDLADAFSRAEDGPEKTALAMTLMGRGAAENIPLLNRGREGLDELSASAARAGVVMDQTTQKSFEASAEKVNVLGESLTGLGETIFKAIEPAFNAIVDVAIEIVQEMNEWIATNGGVQAVLGGVVSAIEAAIAGVLSFIEAWQDLWVIASTIIKSLQTGIGMLGTSFSLAMAGQFTAAAAVAQAGWDHIKNINTDGAAEEAKIVGNFELMKARLQGLSITSANSSGSPDDRDSGSNRGSFKPQGNAAAASDAADAARAKLDGEIAVLKQGETAKQQILNEELQAKQINAQQWGQQSVAAVDVEYKAELGLLQSELQINNLKLAQRQQILSKIEELEQKHADDVRKINEKVAQDQIKSWNEVTGAVGSAVNSQVSSLLNGSETVQTAVENVALSLAGDLIESAIKAISSSAAQAFAGVFAFFSPSLGLGAAAPAAAGEATVMAAASGLSSLDVGTWGLPADMPIMAHAGETIIPSFESSQFRAAMDSLSRGGGRGDTHQWNISAVDPKSFIAMLQDAASPLGKIVAQHFNQNPTARPSF